MNELRRHLTEFLPSTAHRHVIASQYLNYSEVEFFVLRSAWKRHVAPIWMKSGTAATYVDLKSWMSFI